MRTQVCDADSVAAASHQAVQVTAEGVRVLLFCAHHARALTGALEHDGFIIDPIRPPAPPALTPRVRRPFTANYVSWDRGQFI
jgi:7-keto-8-aminopelargonate synthetase-like enzyme